MNIYGFAIIRNGVKFDFPFIESLKSMAELTSKIFIVVGESEDETEKVLRSCKELEGKLEIINTVWDLSFREGGYIFSQQTNIALAALREHCKNIGDTTGWAIYLQSDELFHEEELPLIREDFYKAEASGCDVVRYRYIHFWHSHNKMAINKKWYPQEIRAVKVDSEVLNFGDAQTFEKFTKVYESDAHIYHYGHVRDPEAYVQKTEHQISLHYNDKKIKKYSRRWKRADRHTETLSFYGNHPLVMSERMARLGGIHTLPARDKVYIVGDPSLYSDEIKKKINAKLVLWVKSLFAVPFKDRKSAVIMKESCFTRLFYSSQVPKAMRSRLARPWTRDFYFLMKLSEKDLGLKAL